MPELLAQILRIAIFLWEDGGWVLKAALISSALVFGGAILRGYLQDRRDEREWQAARADARKGLFDA